jgi:hypothetical protein
MGDGDGYHLACSVRVPAHLPFSESRWPKIFIPIILEILKAKYVQETDGSPYILWVLTRGSEDCSVDLLDDPQEEMPIDALGRHGVIPLGFEAQGETASSPSLPRKAACRPNVTDILKDVTLI